MIAARAKAFAAQFVAFTVIGWLVAGLLDAFGALRLPDALVVTGLLMGVVTGVVAFQGGGRPLIRPTSPVLNVPLTDGVGPGVTPIGGRALAVLSAGLAAMGLVAAGALLG